MEGAALAAGTVVDRYAIEAPVGEGGMAAVFRVRHVQLGTVHALKVLTVTNRQIRDRLIQEGRLQAALQHPNVVSVTDTIDLGGTPGLIMEFVDGPTLDDLLRQHRLTLEQADELARGILAGVAAAHRAGLVHRDLKPANILLRLTEQGFVPKVADFGLAKILAGAEQSHGKTRTGSTMGTPHYMSPEQVRDAKNVGTPTDIFALGAILYEMVTSRRAFEGHDLLEIFNAVAAGRYVPPREIQAELPDRMVEAITQALRIEPGDRPKSVDALASLWSGTAVAPADRSAFDTGTMALARSLTSSGSGALRMREMRGGPGTRRETWRGHPTAAEAGRAAVPDLGGSMEAPSGGAAATEQQGTTTSLPDSLVTGRTIALFGIGGTALALLGSAVIVFGAIGAGAIWLLLSAPPAPDIPPAVAEATPVQPAPPPAIAVGEPPTPRVEPVRKAAPRNVIVDQNVNENVDVNENVVPDQVPAAAPETALAPAPAVVPPPPVVTNPIPEIPIGPELSIFLSSTDPVERKKGIDNMAARRDPEADRALAWVAVNDDDSTVRARAWAKVVERMTGGFADYDVLLPLVVRQMSAGERTALQAVDLYAQFGDDADDLAGALQHSSAKVRLAGLDTVEVIGRKFPENGTGYLHVGPLTNDPDPGVAKRAKDVLNRG